MSDPRVGAIPDIHGHAKGEHKPYVEERPIPYSARMLFLWFYHAARRGRPRFMMVADHINYLTFEDPAAVNLVRRALKLAAAGDLYGAAETAGVDLAHAAVVSEGLRRGMRYSIGAEVDNDPRARPDAANIVEAMKPDGLIRSIHFLPIEHPVHGAGWQWPFDNAEFSSLYETVGPQRVWEIYMAALLDAIEKLPGHIVGHFYAPAKFGHWPEDATLEHYEDQVVAACKDRGMALEFNTRFYYRYIEDEQQKRRYLDANFRLLRKAKAHGVGVAIGSDAHSPKDQGEGFDRILQMLDAADVNELVFPIGGRLARVALRALREAAEEAVPHRVPARAQEAEAAARSGAAPQEAVPRSSRASRPRPPRVEKAPSKVSARRPKRPAKKTARRIAGAAAKRRKAATHKAAAAKRKPLAKKASKAKSGSKTAKKTLRPARPARKGAAKRKAAVARKRVASKPSRKASAKKTAAKKRTTKSRR